MARISVNLNDIPDGFEVMEPGKYVGKLIDCVEDESSSGNPMLVWTWEIEGPEYKGREIKSFTSLQEHALFGLKEHLSAFGITGEVDFDTDRLMGKKATLSVTISKAKNRNTGEDMEVNRIQSVSTAKGGVGKSAGKKIDDSDIPF